MTLDEFCLKLGKSKSTILKNGKRTKQTLEKKGICISKVKFEDKTEYYIEYKDNECS